MQVKPFRKRRLDKKALTVLGVFLGLEVIACGGVLFSLQAKRNAMDRTLVAKEANLESVRALSATLPALQKDYRVIQARLAHLEGLLPSEDYVPTLLGQIEKTATGCGLKIAEFRPKPVSAAANEEATTGPRTFQFDLTVTGNYRQVQKMLVSLTNFKKILGLNSVKMMPVGDAVPGKNPTLTTTLSFTAHMLTPDNKPSAAPAANRQTTASADSTARG
jgi:Tfp pilus assembly protein PilO